ncbi:MAG: hypothetical protein LBD96_02080 [Treponema sp.]|jgi:hypothetical protein|nr:hypothetical protein [Treponema sp.]
MSDTVNPWQSPNTEVVAEEGAPRDVLTPVMIRYLKDASPWLRFIGIIGYIGAAILVVIGLFSSIVLISGLSVLDTGLFGGFLGAFIGVLYLAGGVIAFFPARFTYRFGGKIRDYLLSSGTGDLEEALRYNRALWKFSGILLIVYLALIPLWIGGSLVALFSSLF